MKAFYLLVALCLMALCLESIAATEFPDGESSQKLEVHDHPKAKGLRFSLDIPSSWAIEEAKRPNIIAIATSRGGKGTDSCAFGVFFVEQAGWTTETAKLETSESLSSDSRLREAASAANILFRGGGPANLEGLPSRWFRGVSKHSRDGSNIVIEHIFWQVLFDNWFLTISCGSVTAPVAQQDSGLESSFRNFRLISNSLLMVTRWK